MIRARLHALALLGLCVGCAGSLDPSEFEGSDSGTDSGNPDSGVGCDAPGTIFTPVCGSCHHAPPNQLGQLDLTSPGLLSRLVNVSSAGCGTGEILVVPGKPSQSYLYLKVSSAAPACGAQMPLGSSLPTAQIQCISTWITSLAGGSDGGT
jgi:hypothetical protein